MLSAAQRAEINRANAQKSTGPRSQDGKQRSRLNARRHGLTGQVLVIPDEQREAYTFHVQEFYDEHDPQTPTERACVQVMADCIWKLNGSSALQTQLLSWQSIDGALEQLDQKESWRLFNALEKGAELLPNFSLYEQRIWKMFENALKRLSALQEVRRSRKIGFDLSNAENKEDPPQSEAPTPTPEPDQAIDFEPQPTDSEPPAFATGPSPHRPKAHLISKVARAGHETGRLKEAYENS